jgi:flagellar motor switch/type III secretory pathway protein FliN
VRSFAQRVLAGPEELAAPRPLTEVEQALWVLLVATTLEDLGVAGEVWSSSPRSGSGSRAVVLEARLSGQPCTVELRIPTGLQLAPPPPRPLPAWVDHPLDVPILAGRCFLDPIDAAKLRLRTVVTLERAVATAELALFDGALGLRADSSDPLVARVATEYVPRAMALPDDARVELTVGLGTARMSLRQILGLAVGEIVPLGRPLAGPFDIRAQGTLIGQGELVDVDGELGVRIVSLAQE